LAHNRLFLDANILFSAAYRANAGLARFWKIPNVTLCSSRYAVGEARINLGDISQQRRLDIFASKLELFDAPRSVSSTDILLSVSLPDKDRPIFLAAIEARATHLITGDLRHFGPYLDKKPHGILVMTPSAYLRRVGFS
jgi:hypothetical protein